MCALRSYLARFADDVQLLVKLRAVAPTVTAHLWPARLAASAGAELSAFYLIGLGQMGTSEIPAAVEHALTAFVDDIQAHARYYDSASAFVHASTVPRAMLGDDVAPDTFVWPDGGFDAPPDDETDDTEEDDGDAPAKKKIKKGRKKERTPPLPPGVGTAGKLRSSADVYNRLMWDASANADDYLIGYEDRFKGVKEMPLTSWKREVEDEAFVRALVRDGIWLTMGQIPFHRVVHFRRKSDGVTVWDRYA